MSWTIHNATWLGEQREHWHSGVIIVAFVALCPSLSIDLQNSELAVEHLQSNSIPWCLMECTLLKGLHYFWPVKQHIVYRLISNCLFLILFFFFVLAIFYCFLSFFHFSCLSSFFPSLLFLSCPRFLPLSVPSPLYKRLWLV